MENQPTVPTIIDLPKFLDRRGSLSFIEQDKHVPFEIARTYWVYDVPGGSKRGGHAYRRNQEFIVALSGSFDVVLVNERGEKKIWHMNRSYYGLYIPSGWWRELENFATNSVALVLSSTSYDPDDYIRDFEQYRKEFA
ncbi:MAG: WxcM-like domain-containing protein [Akkermansia sp.]|nr:WxcM-like domain-containing protein [Akkermansia sp.]